MTSFKAILFDFDGTLLNTNNLIIETFHYVIEKRFPGKYSKAYYAEHFIGPTLVDSFTSVDAETADEMIAEYRAWNKENHDAYVEVFDGVVETLNALHEAGIRMAIVSTKRRDALLQGIQNLGTLQLFEQIISLDEVSKAKPDPEPILLALSKMGLNKEDVLMVGDNSHDIEGGKNAGVKTAGVAWSLKGVDFLNQYNPDYMLYHMHDLLKIVGVEK